MSTYGDLKKKYDALKKTWESRNHADCGKLLEDIKETLPEVALFPNEGRDAEQKVNPVLILIVAFPNDGSRQSKLKATRWAINLLAYLFSGPHFGA